MRTPALCTLLALAACGSAPPSPSGATTTPAPSPVAAPAPVAQPAAAETLAVDTPRTTVEGTQLFVPAHWTIEVRGAATILKPPEPGSQIAFVDVHATDRDAAVAAAWAAMGGVTKWPFKVTLNIADQDGWTDRASYVYEVPPNERRDVVATTAHAGDTWTVAIFDMTQPVAEKREGELSLIFGRFLPKGYTRESFAGKSAHDLDAKKIAELGAFIEQARTLYKIPGIAIGIVQHGKVVFAGGFGVRALGKPAKVDANTLFMIASNTKAMTTLLLAKLVEDGKLTWDTPVTQAWPSFKLGDADTTRQVLVKHLICACTGLPRQDTEWWFEFKDATPESSMTLLGTMQPTTKFGEAFQYSNMMAAAAGYLAAHVLSPKLELGKGYDAAMAKRVFGPLGMTSTTLDYARALKGDHALPHALDIDDNSALAVMAANYSIVPLRPAGGAWSSVNDLLKYVQMELAKGKLAGGKRYIAEEPLLERRKPQVPIGKDTTYGMGLEVDTTWGTPVVHHGGDMVGFHSDMMWLPDHEVGAVILTNADPGWMVRGPFLRKLLEELFDGRNEAEPKLAAGAQQVHARIAAERKRLTVPADPAAAKDLAARYHNPALGKIAIRSDGAKTILDIGEWQSELASRKNPDGTVSFLTIAPGVDGLELVVGESQKGKRTLITRDGQHEYIFNESE